MILYFQMRFRWMWMLILLICVLVLLAAYQITNIKQAEQRNERLRHSIQSSRLVIESATHEGDEAAIDWKALSAIKGVRMGNLAGMQVRLKLERRFQSYTVEQLTAAMDEIITSDIPLNSKESFGTMVMEVLVQRDPELALVRYAKAFRTSHDAPLYPLAVAIKGWARKDAAAAVAWYDREIAAGTFVGIELKHHDNSRVFFNTQLFSEINSSSNLLVWSMMS